MNGQGFFWLVAALIALGLVLTHPSGDKQIFSGATGFVKQLQAG